METTPRILLEIRQKLPELSGNYRIIAEKIIASPEKIIQEKVNDLAEQCCCDPAQVVRLCQKLGFSGFSGLKNRIATDLILSKHTLHKQITESMNSFDRLKMNLSSNFTRTINDTLSKLPEERLVQAMELIRQARQIIVCGFGSSGLAARDLQIKLMRIGFMVMFFDDAEVCKTTCATLSTEDLLIVISFSGETAYVMDNVKIALKNHIPILALTNYEQSSIAQNANCILLTIADEERLRLCAMDSIISQYLVIVVLTSYLTGKIPEQAEQRILQIFENTDPRSVQKFVRNK